MTPGICVLMLCAVITISAIPIKTEAESVVYEHVTAFPDVGLTAMRFAVISPDGKRIALPIREGQGEYVLVNGVRQATYLKIVSRTINWSFDSLSLVYAAEKDGDQFLVRDGTQSNLGGHICQTGYFVNTQFSADGKHLLWVATVDNGTSVFVDGVTTATTERVSYAAFQGSGGDYVWIGGRACREFVADSVYGEHPMYDLVGVPQIAQYGSKYIYRAQTLGEFSLVREDKAVVVKFSAPFQFFALSPDASRVAYLEDVSTATGIRSRFNITGLAPIEFEGETKNGRAVAVFSRDSKRVIYAASDGEGVQVFVDTDKPKRWVDVLPTSFVWSKDGSRFAYFAYDSQSGIFAVTDNGKSSRHQNAVPGSLKFREDGSTLAYIASKGVSGKEPDFYVVIDGSPDKRRYSEISRLAFFNGNHVAYLAKKDGKRYLVLPKKTMLLDVDVYYAQTLA